MLRKVGLVVALALGLVLASIPAGAYVTGSDPSGDGTRAIDIKGVTYMGRFAVSATKIYRVVSIRGWDRFRPLHIDWVKWQLDSTGGGAPDYVVTATYQAGAWQCTLASLRDATSVAGETFGGPSGVGCKIPIHAIVKSKAVRFRAAAAGTDSDPDSLWVDLAPDTGWYGG